MCVDAGVERGDEHAHSVVVGVLRRQGCEGTGDGPARVEIPFGRCEHIAFCNAWPACGGYQLQATGGTELRVVDLLVDDDDGQEIERCA